MLAKLAGSDLTALDASKLGFEPIEGARARQLGYPAAADGFLLPYFDTTGKRTSFARLRYLEDTRSGFDKLGAKKALRYGQRAGTINELYLPPLINWITLAERVDIPLLITEGELKAACATKNGLPTIGLGGVWCFQSAKTGDALLPGFDAFKWADRKVYIIYDSDASTNVDIVQAEQRLAVRLVERGAVVYICRLPHHNASDVLKTGLDDYLMLNSAEELHSAVLETAFEYESSKALHEMNARCIYVGDPGIVFDHRDRRRILPAAFVSHAFSNHFYYEEKMTAKGKVALEKIPLAKAWLDWPHRSEAKGLTFEPGSEEITQDGYLNTWTSWGLARPTSGDVSEWHRLLEHVFGLDQQARRYFEQWAAYPLQHPGAKMATAVAVWGVTHGSGKTLIGETLMRIYGDLHSAELKDQDLEDARFQWAIDCQFVLADDITSKGDRKFMRKLMTMITQKRMRLDPKYVPSYTIPDRINYYFTSNDPDALFMDDGDRRFFVHETKAGKFDYHNYVKWMRTNDGAQALWAYLLELSLKGFDPQAPAPMTSGKKEMIDLGKSDLGMWVLELKENASEILAQHNIQCDLSTAAELHALYDPNGVKRAGTNALARELKRAGFRPPANGSKLRLISGAMRMYYVMRNHDKWYGATWREACDHASAFLLPNKRAKF